MPRSISFMLSVTLAACTTREPTSAQPSPAPVEQAQRVQLELVRVPDALAQPVIAELGLPAIGLIAARHRIDPHWHIYWRNPGSAGLPTRLTASPGPGSTLEVGEPLLPAPDRFEDAFGWENEAIVFLPILAGEGDVDVRSKWVACNADACVAGENQAKLGSTPAIDDPGLRAMLDRLPRPLGERLTSHAWTTTDDRVTLELTLSADARTIELLPDASDPALFFEHARFDPEPRTLTIDWRPGNREQALPNAQGVLAWTDDAHTRYYDLSLPWPE